jgi:hypothetical protein
MTRSTLALANVAVLMSFPAAAHDLWLEPSTFRPAPGIEVTATLLVGQGLHGESLPRNPMLIDRFVLRGEGPEMPVGGAPGDDPAGSVRVSETGLHWIGYQSHPYPVVLEAGRFEDYLRDEGLERILEERARKGQSAAGGRERFYRCAKSLLDVAGEKPPAGKSRVFGTPFGFTLELVPDENPYALAPGSELPVLLSFRGKPIPNVLVVALNKNAPDKRVSARTDAKGRVRLPLARPGLWLVKAVYMDAAPPHAGVDWESWWASMTFDLASSVKK